MTHKLVSDLYYVHDKFEINFDDLSDKDARTRVGHANSISWIIGHLAHFEQYTHCEIAQGKTVSEAVKVCGFGKPASTPPLAEMLDGWREITAVAKTFLDPLTEDDMQNSLTMPDGGSYGENIGTMLYRHTWHYWYHIGEIQGIRQALGHENLPQFIGRMTPDVVYTPES